MPAYAAFFYKGSGFRPREPMEAIRRLANPREFRTGHICLSSMVTGSDFHYNVYWQLVKPRISSTVLPIRPILVLQI